MSAKLMRCAEQIAREKQRQKTQQVAERLKGLLGSAAVEVAEARVLVTGRGLVKRWLIDPSLRFLAGGPK